MPESEEFNPLKAELNHICHLLASLGAHHIVHVSRVRINKVRGKKQGDGLLQRAALCPRLGLWCGNVRGRQKNAAVVYFTDIISCVMIADNNSNNNNNSIYLLQLGCHPVAVVILHVNKT